MMGNDFLYESIQYTKGIGPQRAKQLQHLGISTLEDALYHLPLRYEDRSSIKKISQLSQSELVTVQGKIISADVISIPRRKFKIFELTISDGSGILKAKWFNQPFMKKVFHPGQKLFLSGTVKINSYYGIGFEIDNPEYEFITEKDSLIHTSRIVPIYRTVSGLGQKVLRTALYNAVTNSVHQLHDFIPEEILARHSFVGIREALRNVHFPDSTEIVELNTGTTPYHRRLSFDEFFLFQLGICQIKKGGSEEKGIRFSCPHILTEDLSGFLPFRLTSAQQKVLHEIYSDMASLHPMNRLIQGDVGSGKTIVALFAMLRAVECGFQAAIMAPTEILAQQHYFNIKRILDRLGVKCALLTSKARNGDENADITIGTHSLIQEETSFRKLGLVIIDEQHRFGVRQRFMLRKKGLNPDVLIMTATPIPRTLALTVYGDMEYSSIDELPPGRHPVETLILPDSHKKQVYDIVYREVKNGGQVYIVYPIIEENEKSDLRSAEIGKEALKNIFPKFSIELVHGKMKPEERQKIMREFQSGNVQVLVSTTVIEVGVDVPNANVMIIVHAERFGLSQLHQLRGRVGRGGRSSFCILLFYGKLTEDAEKRLNIMRKTQNGFKIAEEDLLIRGPGDFFGTKQSGIPDFRVANLIRDRALLEVAEEESRILLQRDPLLSRYPLLREKVNRMWNKRLEFFTTA